MKTHAKGDRVRVCLGATHFGGLSGVVVSAYVPTAGRCGCWDLGIRCGRDCKILPPAPLYWVRLDADQLPDGYDPVMGFLATAIEMTNDHVKRVP
jgi:hypothetical protein